MLTKQEKLAAKGVSRRLRFKCPCPLYCKYCGARRRADQCGHYCPTKNCDWQHGYKMCTGALITHRGIHSQRLTSDNPREVAFAEQWEQENIPREHSMYFHGSLLDVLLKSKASQQTATNVATVIQWLGSNVGFSFLLESLHRCGFTINKTGETKCRLDAMEV